MQTVADSRKEKNEADARSEYQDQKLQKRNQERIDFMKSQIEEEKAAIKDCLDQDFFSMAKSKLERIETIKAGIAALNAVPEEKKVNLVSWTSLNHYYLQKLLKRNELDKERNCEYLDNGCTIEPLSLTAASGRSKCRLTGKRIPKGETVIKGLYDFNGAGSYTAQVVYLSIEAYNQKFKEDPRTQ